MPINIMVAKRKGVLFLDVLIGVAVFAIVVSGVIYAMLFSQQGMLKSGDRIRGVFLAQQAIAVARAVRDDDFANLAEGTFGISKASGTWELSGTGSVTADGYTIQVVVSSVSTDVFDIEATVSWSFSNQAQGEVTLRSQITDWRRVSEIGDWSSVSLDGAYIDDDTPLFNRATYTQDYAFVTSETSDGGDGLYVFDITTLSSPTRTAETFNLGVAGHDLLIVDDTLFVATEDASQEVRIYDIADPANLQSSDLLASINVPGDSNARVLAYYDDTLFVGALEDAGESEFFSYNVSDLESIVLLDELNDPGSSYSALTLRDGYAYLASSLDTMELRVVDVFDPENLTFASGGGYNLTDTPDGNAIANAGDFILVGRDQGSVTEEFHLFDVSETPVPEDAPQNAEAGQNVHSLAADPTAAYGFAATEHDDQELVILDLDTFASGGNPLLDVYNTTTGIGRGVTYDVLHDRVFLMTNTAFIILEPS